jgi:hypothetical protein
MYDFVDPSQFSDSEIAAAWVRMQRTRSDLPEYEELFWAYEAVDELCRMDAERCWRVLAEIRRQDASDDLLGIWAAGPLEDLLALWGATFIDRFETLAIEDSSFRAALGMVWRNDIDEDVWERVQRAAGWA